jgi:hypothetical protein
MHRTLSGGTPDSPVRQTRAAFGYPLLSLLNPAAGDRRKRGGNPAAFVFVPCPGRVRLQ